jgi:hypothetical protein
LRPFTNGRLADAIANIDWENDQFELVFITFGKINEQARAVSEQAPDYPADVPDLEERCDWKFLDETDINVELRNARSVAAGISAKPFSLHPMGIKGQRGHSVISVAAGKQKSYVMTLDAYQLVNAYKALGQDAIFSLNIRNYVGKTRTNKQIVETARRDPENFYMFNNGISCLATKVTVTDNAVEVIGLQVINGAQTIRSLVHVGKFGSQVPFVLVRITEIAEGYGSGGKIREQITRFNNTQNTIKLSDFRSNDPVQSALTEQFKSVVRNGRKVAYLPKRTDKVPANHEIVRLEEFANPFMRSSTAQLSSQLRPRSFLMTARMGVMQPYSAMVLMFGSGCQKMNSKCGRQCIGSHRISAHIYVQHARAQQIPTLALRLSENGY